MSLEDRIRHALRDCRDPIQALNLIDLGCVGSITAVEDVDAPGAGIPGVPPRFQASITLFPASDDEADQAQVIALVHNRLAGMPELSRTFVRLENGWTPSRISPDGRRLIQLARPLFPILNNQAR